MTQRNNQTSAVATLDAIYTGYMRASQNPNRKDALRGRGVRYLVNYQAHTSFLLWCLLWAISSTLRSAYGLPRKLCYCTRFDTSSKNILRLDERPPVRSRLLRPSLIMCCVLCCETRPKLSSISEIGMQGTLSTLGYCAWKKELFGRGIFLVDVAQNH